MDDNFNDIMETINSINTDLNKLKGQILKLINSDESLPNSNNHAWDKCQNEYKFIKNKVSDMAFKTWFDSLIDLEVKDNILYITAPQDTQGIVKMYSNLFKTAFNVSKINIK